MGSGEFGGLANPHMSFIAANVRLCLSSIWWCSRALCPVGETTPIISAVAMSDFNLSEIMQVQHSGIVVCTVASQ